MSFETNNFYVARKNKLETSEINSECNLVAGENVEKILAVSLDAYVQNCEVLNGVVNYSAIIDSRIVFINDAHQVNTVCSSCPFNGKFESENILNGQQGFVHLKVIDYNIDYINIDNIKLSVVLEQCGFVVDNNEISSIKSDDEDICLKTDEIVVTKFIGSVKDEFNEESEIFVHDNDIKILLTETRAYIKNVDSGVNIVSVSGEVVTKILYLVNNEKFENGYIYEPFKHEVELKDVDRDSFVEARCFVKSDMVTTEIIDDENKGKKIVVKSPISLYVCAFKNENISIVSDLYSTQNELQVSTQSFSYSTIKPTFVCEGKIEGNMVLPDDSPRVDKILFNGGNSAVVTNCYIKDNELFIEGIAKTSVVYLNDETGTLNSVQIDIPFGLSDKVECDKEYVLSVDLTVCDVDVIVKKGRELFYDSKIKAVVNCCQEDISGVICDVNVVETLPQKEYSMELIFAKENENLWDIAKKIRVKEDQILSQNPDISFPLSDNQSLIIYYKKR